MPQGGWHQVAPISNLFAEDLDLGEDPAEDDHEDDDSMDDDDLFAAAAAAEGAHADRVRAAQAPAAAPALPTQQYSMPQVQEQGFVSAGFASAARQPSHQYAAPARTGQPRACMLSALQTSRATVPY